MKVNRTFVVLLFLILGIPIVLSVASGAFGGIEGFECWCRDDDPSCSGSQSIAPIGSPVIDLGPLGSSIWGNIFAGFPDPNARIIWNTASALSGAPPNATPVIFSKVFDNPSKSAGPATLYVMVDDTADIFLNRAAVGSVVNCCVVKNISINLQPGKNSLIIAAKNLGASPNPAGLVVSIVDSSGSVLARTDSTWTFQNSAVVP